VVVAPTVQDHLAGVRRLLADPDERKAMGARGLAAVRARYSWEAIEGDLLGFYAELRRGLRDSG